MCEVSTDSTFLVNPSESAMKKTIIGTIILLFTVLFEGCASNSSQKLTTIPTTEKDQIQLLNMTATLPATAIQEPPTSSPEPTEISPPTATATEVSPQLGGEHSLITWYYGGEKTMPQSLNKYFDSITDEEYNPLTDEIGYELIGD